MDNNLIAFDEAFKSKNILSFSVYSDKTSNKEGHKWYSTLVYKYIDEGEELQASLNMTSVSLEGMILKLIREIKSKNI